jgi:hypothetical protein
VYAEWDNTKGGACQDWAQSFQGNPVGLMGRPGVLIGDRTSSSASIEAPVVHCDPWCVSKVQAFRASEESPAPNDLLVGRYLRCSRLVPDCLGATRASNAEIDC